MSSHYRDRHAGRGPLVDLDDRAVLGKAVVRVRG